MNICLISDENPSTEFQWSRIAPEKLSPLLSTQASIYSVLGFCFLGINARACVQVAIDTYLLKNVLLMSLRFMSLKQTHEFSVLLNF